MDAEEKLAGIKSNLQEVVGEEKVKEILQSGRDLNIYWGTGKMVISNTLDIIIIIIIMIRINAKTSR